MEDLRNFQTLITAANHVTCPTPPEAWGQEEQACDPDPRADTDSKARRARLTPRSPRREPRKGAQD